MRKVLGALAVFLFLVACTGISNGGPPRSPLLGDLQGAVGPWYEDSGAQLPTGQPFVMDVWSGPSHCGWQNLVFLIVSWPLGTRVPGAFMGSGKVRMFVRAIPGGGLPASYFRSTFVPNATLPTDAHDTGYHRAGWRLWVSDRQIGRAVWLVNGATVERWPAAKQIIACA